jgi:anaerobic magnesium-protoporphyrin IX monomethyl ester cyclase
MRLLLTHGYFLADDFKEQKIMKPYVPLGLLYLSSHLREKGIDVDIYDSTFGSKDDLFSLLDHGEPATLGIYGNLMTRANVLAIAARARTLGWRVILGGPEPANYAEEYLTAGADVIVAGEGENALEQLMTTGFVPARWLAIKGIIFRSPSGEVIRTGSADLIQSLDAQPWPDRGRVSIESYLQTWREFHGSGSLSVITARGCPYRCNWCSHSVYGMTHRRRSPGSVVNEVEWLLGRYNPDMLWMADDVFTIHPGWIAEYAVLMKQRGIHIPFECITRADRLNERMVGLLAELGCMRVWIGSESGSQRILDAMDRGVTVEQVRNAVTLCKQAGIQTGMFLMWGYDGEEISDVEATIDHVKQCQPDIFFTTVSYPIKGTPYFNKVADRLVTLGNWRSSTDRDAAIRGRHSRNFYKHADELLRSEAAVVSDAARIDAARAALHAAASEVEA